MLNNSGIALLGVQDASGIRSSNPNEYEYEYGTLKPLKSSREIQHLD